MTSRGKIAIRLNEGDAVGWAALCTLGDSLVVATAKGMLLKYDVDAVRETARATMGVKALKLRSRRRARDGARDVAPDKPCPPRRRRARDGARRGAGTRTTSQVDGGS